MDKKLQGSVTISLKDYHALLDLGEHNKKIREHLETTARELGVFLTFVGTRPDMDKLIEDFNLQSTTSRIDWESGRAKVHLRDDNNTI